MIFVLSFSLGCVLDVGFDVYLLLCFCCFAYWFLGAGVVGIDCL